MYSSTDNSEFEKPRKLTKDEIFDIVSIIPKVRAASVTVAANNYQSILDVTMKQLAEIEIKPSKIPKLKAIIFNQCSRAEIQPGDNVGLIASEAIGQPISQATLNSFHSAGAQSTGSYGLHLFIELFNVSQNRRQPKCYIHFLNKYLTFLQCVSLSKCLTITPLSNFLDKKVGTGGIDIIKYSYADHYNPRFVSVYKLSNPDFDNELFFNENVAFLRLYFDKWLLFSSRVSIGDIVNTLINLSLDKKKSSKIICIPHQTYDGIVDIFANVEKIDPVSFDINTDIMSYFQNDIIPKFSNESFGVYSSTINSTITKVFGNSQLYKSNALALFKNAIPIVKNVTEMILSDTKTGENERTIWINRSVEHVTGIPREKIFKLVELVGGSIDRNEPDRIVVSIEGLPDNSGELVKLINIKIDENAELESSEIRTKRKTLENFKTKNFFERVKIIQNNLTKPIQNDFLLNSKYVYILGINGNMPLKQLLIHPAIDTSKTITDNPNEIAVVMGIEAARACIFRELNDLIRGTGKMINPRHIQIIVNAMTWSGNLLAFTASGSSLQGAGALADASFQEAEKAFRRSAVAGEDEPVTSASACVLFGNKVKFGTGIFTTTSETVIPRSVTSYIDPQKILENPQKRRRRVIMETVENEEWMASDGGVMVEGSSSMFLAQKHNAESKTSKAEEMLPGLPEKISDLKESENDKIFETCDISSINIGDLMKLLL